MNDGEIEGFSAQMHRSLGYLQEIWRVCVLVCEKLECVQLMCPLLLDVLDGRLSGWMANYRLPSGKTFIHVSICQPLFFSAARLQCCRADMLLQGQLPPAARYHICQVFSPQHVRVQPLRTLTGGRARYASSGRNAHHWTPDGLSQDGRGGAVVLLKERRLQLILASKPHDHPAA